MRTVETLVAVLLASVATAFAYQSTPTMADPPCFVPLRLISCHDADTLTADVLLPFGDVVLTGQVIRAQGYDAWEINRTRKSVAITDDEIRRGKIARDALKKLIAESTGLYATPSKEPGVYGRTSAYLWVRQNDAAMLPVAKWAADNGHCRGGVK